VNRYIAAFAVWLLTCPHIEADEIELDPTIASNLRELVAYRIHEGRVVLDTGHFAGNVSLRGKRPSSPERFSLEVTARESIIRYSQSTWNQEVSLEMRRARRESWEVQLERRPRGESEVTHVRFVQRPGEPLELRLAGERTAQANSLWSLWLREPELCREHLMPLLELLRPAWHLPEQARDVERMLALFAQEDTPLARRQWREWVAKLGSDSAFGRQRAFRALREAAPANLRYLVSIDPQTLDAEQQQRLAALVERYVLPHEDTPVSAAIGLERSPVREQGRESGRTRLRDRD
jgi:hypothetical protein